MFRTTLLTVFLLVQVVFGGLPATYRRNGRIMGGMDANPGQYPSQISLRNSMNQHYCGGSIVNDHWVLSSSQCTTAVGAQPANLLVVVGSHLLSTGGISHECSEVINHPKYNPMNFANDIAVIKTTTPMNIGSNTIQPIPIINRAITNEVWGQLVGWGTKGQNEGSYPENLQWVYSNIIPHSECSKKFKSMKIQFVALLILELVPVLVMPVVHCYYLKMVLSVLHLS